MLALPMLTAMAWRLRPEDEKIDREPRICRDC
jgi:hypothetical protein